MTEKEWKIEFSNRIKRRMEELNLNQHELSRRTHIPANTICMYVNGRCVPRATVIPRLAVGLILPVSELVDF